MKKLSVIILAVAMLFSLVGCGGAAVEEVSLVEVTTVEGVTLLLPSDLALQTIQEKTAYVNTETGESVVFAVIEVDETPIATWTEEDILMMYQSSRPGVAVESFENGVQINGNDALVTSVSYTTENGNDIIITLVIITAGEYNYVLNFTTGVDSAAGSLAANMEECINSITIAE
ncbi:MAG: hypothetical protein EOM59_07365 [Clostridia bacterium]|nr:hypothetical protein [Clostridia bacterium]